MKPNKCVVCHAGLKAKVKIRDGESLYDKKPTWNRLLTKIYLVSKLPEVYEELVELFCPSCGLVYRGL